MTEKETVTFTDVVKKIKQNKELHTYTVIFKRSAAFYNVESRNVTAVEALTRSAQGLLPVTVVSRAVACEILEAYLVA
ncbi:MAG: hypothetical protein RDV48_01895 [Candidatus Eremiobacteraeota bacterium]|nr:hypothetical protein [Candidatus Eremiobacteraeota bacterium]